MYHENRLKLLIAEIENDKVYTPENRKLILSFVDTCRSRQLTDRRIVFYLNRLKRICQFRRKDFSKWTREDVEATMGKVNDYGYKAWTIENYKTTFKVFFRWLHKLDRTDPTPRIVSWLSRETPPNTLRKEDLLTRDEINRMIGATGNIKWKCLIATLAAGPRPSELFSIRIRDVLDEGEFVKVYVRGKMHRKMGERCIYVGFYIKGHDDYIRMWIREHPERSNPEAQLIPRLNNANLLKNIRIFAQKAGIERRVWPYLFRHTFGTWVYGNYESAYARRLMGHAAGSKMESVYCHLSETDIVERLLGRKPVQIADKPDAISQRKNKQDVMMFIMSKLWESRPELRRMVEEASDAYAKELQDMVNQRSNPGVDARKECC